MPDQSKCTMCRLQWHRRQVVVSDGAIKKNDVVVIGEAPGEQEDREGVPFVGKSGKLLRDTCWRMARPLGEHKHRSTIVLNTVSCHPPDNRNPKPEEIEACSGWLALNLQLIAPSFVLLVGKIAAEQFLPKRLLDQRGKLFYWIDLLPRWQNRSRYRFAAMHVYHPSYIQRCHSEQIEARWAIDLCRFFDHTRNMGEHYASL